MDEHGEGDMSVPGVPGADLVVVEADFVLGRSETFLDGPACPGHVHEFTEVYAKPHIFTSHGLVRGS